LGLVPTTHKLLVPQFGPGPDHPQTPRSPLRAWSRPPTNSSLTTSGLVPTTHKLLAHQFGPGPDHPQTPRSPLRAWSRPPTNSSWSGFGVR